MKKLVIINCLIFAVLLFLVDNLYAQDVDNLSSLPVINIDGYVNVTGSYSNENKIYSKDQLPDANALNGNSQPGTHNNMNNLDVTNEAEIRVKVVGSDLGIKYGGVVQLESNINTTPFGSSLTVDKAYIFTESMIGKLEFGNNVATDQTMKVGPGTFARGVGGINGQYLQYVNLPMLADASQLGISRIGNCNGYQVNNSGNVTGSGSNCSNIKLPSFILIPQLPIASGGYAQSFYDQTKNGNYGALSSASGYEFNKPNSLISDGSFGDMVNATKISYYTPRYSGLQLGVSVTPDAGNASTASVYTGNNVSNIKDVVSYGLNYSDSFGNIGLAISGTGEFGKYEQLGSGVARNNLQAYELGVVTTYLGFTVGASYGIWGKSLQPKSGIYSCQYNPVVPIANQDCSSATVAGSAFNSANYWTLGSAYQFGPFATSLTYINSQFQNNRYNALSWDVDYKMAKGLMPYFEVTKFAFKANQAKYLDNGVVVNQNTLPNSAQQIQNNSGYVVLAGLLLSF